MKTKLFLLLLIITSTTFSQTRIYQGFDNGSGLCIDGNNAYTKIGTEIVRVATNQANPSAQVFATGLQKNNTAYNTINLHQESTSLFIPSGNLNEIGTVFLGSNPPANVTKFSISLLHSAMFVIDNNSGIDGLYFVTNPGTTQYSRLTKVTFPTGSPVYTIITNLPANYTDVYDAVVDGSNVYFTNRGSGSSNGSIIKVDLSQGSPTAEVLVSGLESPWGIDFAYDQIYFTTNTANGGIKKVHKGGGTVQDFGSSIPFAGNLDIEGSDIYAISQTSVSNGGGLYRYANVVVPTCDPPINIAASINTVTESTITWDAAIAAVSYDVTYVAAGQPMSSGTTISGVTTTSTTLTGLTPDAFYDVYIKTNCNATVSPSQSGYSQAFTFRQKAVIFVDPDATGTNDGSSWQNAYVNLNTAIANVPANFSIWVAAGTYKPTGTNRGNRITINKNNLKMYGGFAGSEADLSDRDMSLIHTTNATIFSGDIVGNDDANVTFNNSTRTDNVHNVLYIDANDVLLDGFIVSGGQADATSGQFRFGAGIKTNSIRHNFTLKNSLIKNNVALWAAGISITASSFTRSNIIFDSCIFENNLANSAAAFYVIPSQNRTLNFTMVNSLLKDNRTEDFGTNMGRGGSTGWVRAFFPNSGVVNLAIVNNTFVGNTNGGTATSDYGTLAISQQSGFYGTKEIANNIFWDNKDNAGSTAVAIGKLSDNALPSNVSVVNSIDENNFSNISSTTNTSNNNPLFTDAANDDYTLQPSSPAINGGDNTKIPAGITTDLAGNTRIENATVDMGCYEKLLLTITVSPKVYLQGAYTNASTLMRDDLRAGGHLPTATPYNDGVSSDVSIFSTTGNDAIVDWVFVELRDKNDNTSILHSKSALLQRDGDIVGLDGSSALVFTAPVDDYYVVIRHRNHLSVMSANVIALSNTITTVDFTDPTTQTFGTNAQTSSGTPTGVMGMWSGNVNGDTIVQYSGTTPDAPSILSQVLNDAGNFLNFPTYVVSGYNTFDINMDGDTQYTGTTPDTPFILQNVLAHPGNFLNFSTYQIQEQLPEN